MMCVGVECVEERTSVWSEESCACLKISVTRQVTACMECARTLGVPTAPSATTTMPRQTTTCAWEVCVLALTAATESRAQPQTNATPKAHAHTAFALFPSSQMAHPAMMAMRAPTLMRATKAHAAGSCSPPLALSSRSSASGP